MEPYSESFWGDLPLDVFSYTLQAVAKDLTGPNARAILDPLEGEEYDMGPPA